VVIRWLWQYGGTDNSEVAGEYFSIDDVFSFLIVRNSGHLLPMDLPSTALEMLERFIRGGDDFKSLSLPSEETYLKVVF